MSVDIAGPDQATATQPEVMQRRRPRPAGVLVAVAWFWLTIVLFLAAFGRVIGLPAYDETVGSPALAPSFGDVSTLLGTDPVGRSVLSRLAAGAQVSGLVGIAATAIALVVGGLLGLLSAYYHRADRGIGILTDTVLAFPPLIMLMAIAAVMEQSLVTLILALAVLGTPGFVRLTKANALQALGQEYVTASRAMGATTRRIVFREVLPNAAVPLISYSVIVAAVIMVAEGSLSFLGLGIPPPSPSWGTMIATGQGMLATSPQLVFIPAVALFLTVFSLNTVGDSLRTRLSRD